MKKWTLLLISSLFLLSFGAMAQITPGQTVPDVNLPGTDGKNHTFSALSGKKAVVVIFLSVNCPVSNAYVGRIAALVDEFSGKNVEFVGVFSNRREEIKEIDAYAKKSNLNFTMLRDEGNSVADQFDAKFTPEVYVMDGERTLLYHGRIDDSQRVKHVRKSDLKDALNAIVAGKKVADARTKSFGCSIKRSR